MKFIRLHDPLLKVLFENDEIVVIDKPYGISSHTNDSKAGNEAYVQHGLIELFESQLGRKLHIIHRLDRTTTGVIVFAKSLEAAAKFQGYFRERKTEKTYLFITASKSPKAELNSNAPILSKGSELEAETSFTRRLQSKDFDLWEARPRTGRKHQIRIHAAALGIPLLGDVEYGGSPYPFICLHDKCIRFPGDLSIEAKPPVYFDHLEWLGEEWFASKLFDIDRRTRLFGEGVGTVRLAVGLEGFGDRAVATVSGRGQERLSEFLGRDVIVQGAGGEWTVEENGVKFELRADSPASVGLFLDQRLQRNWIKEISRGRDVLNLFAGNCTSSVAAAKGQAKQVTSVEMRKSSLEWGRKNFEINELSRADFKFLCRDSIGLIQQFATKGTAFDLIICDVPSFFRREKGVFRIEEDLESLLMSCLMCLKPGGELLFSTSAPSLKIDDIRKTIESAGRKAKAGALEVSNVLPSLDFELPGEIPVLKSFIVKR